MNILMKYQSKISIPSCSLPTQWGLFRLFCFVDGKTNKEHLAITFGEIDNEKAVLVRIHSECMTGDSFFSLRCDCGPQLEKSMVEISENGSGILLYLRQEGRGIGLVNKIKAYDFQDKGLDTVAANHALGFEDDQRSYSQCKLMLDYFGLKEIDLLTNNPRKIDALKSLGYKVNRKQIQIKSNAFNEKYLQTKKSKLGHLLTTATITSGTAQSYLVSAKPVTANAC